MTMPLPYRAHLASPVDDKPLSPFPVPHRITQALDAKSLYGPDVDRACGVEEPAVDLWEAGELVPTDEQVRLLAELTEMPFEFFYLPCDQGDRPPSSMWMCDRSKRKHGCQHITVPDPICAPLGVS
jgi:hypothetical protein